MFSHYNLTTLLSGHKWQDGITQCASSPQLSASCCLTLSANTSCKNSSPWNPFSRKCKWSHSFLNCPLIQRNGTNRTRMSYTMYVCTVVKQTALMCQMGLLHNEFSLSTNFLFTIRNNACASRLLNTWVYINNKSNISPTPTSCQQISSFKNKENCTKLCHSS